MGVSFSLWDVANWDVLVWDGNPGDNETPSLTDEIKAPHSRVFRRAFIKRRQLSDGLFESDWQEITDDVKIWGRLTSEIDFRRSGKIRFANTSLLMNNKTGAYNPDDNSNSLWNGFANQQRTLIKIEAGFDIAVQQADGLIANIEFPADPTRFIGILSGNMGVSDRNEVTIPIKPVNQVFKDFPARLLTGFTSTGLAASDFMNLLRDQTVGGGFLFRPFFGDTTTNWSITATTINYDDLNTATSAELQDLDCWDVIERLSEAEQFFPYITPTGVFRFSSKTVGASSIFNFNGVGTNFDRVYGRTIKKVNSYGKKLTSFYSRVAVKFVDENTTTSFVNTGTALAINGTNTAWNLGHRTFSIKNFWIPNTATASTVASSVFTELSSLKEEIDFTTTFVPHIEILDRITVNYDPTENSELNSLWDINNWDTELTWDASQGDAIFLKEVEFKVLSVSVDLEKLETRYVAKQL